MVNKCSLRSVRWLAGWLLPLKIHVKAVEQYICSMRTCCPQEFLEVAEREVVALYFAFSRSVLVLGLWLTFVIPSTGEGERGESVTEGLRPAWSI